MKKKVFLAAALAAAMSLSHSWVLAQEIDLSSYTLDQLIELRDKVDTLIAEAENSEPENLGDGVYEVGVDLAEGSYDITFAEDADGGKLSICVYESKEHMEIGYSTIKGTVDYEENSEIQHYVTLDLKEGNILILGGDGVIKAVDPS